MDTYVVLLRGINVGGKNRLPMNTLSDILTRFGCKNIRTYLQSGNVILENDSFQADRVATAIFDHFGFKPDIIVLNKSQFLAAVKKYPFRVKDGKTAHLYFCSKSPKADKDKIEQLLSETEQYRLRDWIFYLHAPDGIGRSKLVANLESCLGVSVTGRNLNTIRKLQQLLNN